MNFEGIILLFGLGTLIAYAFQRLKLPTVLGFILTGVVIGPHGFNVIQEEHIKELAHVGIIFLLFMVGLELSISKIKQLKFQAPIAGVLQLGLTTVFLTLIFRFLLYIPFQMAFLLGSILSLSSTAIVLKALEDNSEIDTVHGRLILGILIIQDLSIIPLMTLLPTFTQQWTPEVINNVVIVMLKATLFTIIAVVVSLKLIPKLLDRLASVNRKDIFILAVASICLGMAQVTNELGLSYEAGAFIAGLALSGSVFCRQIISDIHSFREVFVALFFVSMGLLFDLHFMQTHTVQVIVTLLCLFGVKALAAFTAITLTRLPLKTALWGALSLFQVGEFSFILLERTRETVTAIPAWEGLMRQWMPLLINAIVISMFITPLVINGIPVLIQWLARKRGDNTNILEAMEEEETLPDKVIIAGYGPIASHLASALEFEGIPYVVVEMNIGTVKRLQQQGIPCVYGDISQPDILESAGIHQACMLVVTFPDTRTTELALYQARRMNPNLYCLARSRYRSDVDKLRTLGADEVIYEELESSIGFVFQMMQHLEIPLSKIDQIVSVIRNREREMMKVSPGASPGNKGEQPVFGRFSILEGTKIEWIEVKDDCVWVGKTLSEAGIRQQTGVNVVSVIDGDAKTQVSPGPDLVIKAGDVLVVVGNLDQLRQLENLAVSG